MKNKLREIRVLRRISQYVLSLQTGIPQCKVSLIENSLVAPKEDEKKRLAKVFNKNVEDIFPSEEKRDVIGEGIEVPR